MVEQPGQSPFEQRMSAGGQLAPGWGTEILNFTPWCLHVSQCVPQLVNAHTFGCLCRAMGSWGVGLVWDCPHTLHTPMPLDACVAVGQSCQKCGKCVSGVGWLTLIAHHEAVRLDTRITRESRVEA